MEEERDHYHKNFLSENIILEGHSTHGSIIIFIYCWANIMKTEREGSLVGRGGFCALGKSPCLLLFWPIIFHDEPKGKLENLTPWHFMALKAHFLLVSLGPQGCFRGLMAGAI